MIIETILTQRTNWRNAERAVENLKSVQLDPLYKISKLKNKPLLLIKPAGFYRQKSKYLIGLAKFIVQNGGIGKISEIPLSDLRLALLRLKGIGPETADSILLYALEKPTFVIDEYTRRLVKKEKISKNLNYEHLRQLFEAHFKKDYRLYQYFHALIVIDAKNHK